MNSGTHSTTDGTAALLDEHGKLTYAGYRAVREAMTLGEWRRVQDKCRWEQMIPWAVLNEWPDLRGSGARVLAHAAAERNESRTEIEARMRVAADAVDRDDKFGRGEIEALPEPGSRPGSAPPGTAATVDEREVLFALYEAHGIVGEFERTDRCPNSDTEGERDGSRDRDI